MPYKNATDLTTTKLHHLIVIEIRKNLFVKTFRYLHFAQDDVQFNLFFLKIELFELKINDLQRHIRMSLHVFFFLLVSVFFLFFLLFLLTSLFLFLIATSLLLFFFLLDSFSPCFFVSFCLFFVLPFCSFFLFAPFRALEFLPSSCKDYILCIEVYLKISTQDDLQFN